MKLRSLSVLGAIAASGLLVSLFGGAACGDDETSSSKSSQGGNGTGGNNTGGNAGGAGGEGAGTSVNHNADCAPPEGAAGNLRLTPISTGFTFPILVTSPWGSSDRIYVVSLLGQITAVDSDGTQSTFLDLSGTIEVDGEGGLLGLAFHPDYVDNGRFFVHYTELSTPLRSVIAEYRRDPGNPDIADPNEVGRLLTVEQPFSNHDGGSIEFSPVDGLLHIGWGDGGSANDPQGNSQNISNLLGTISRIDVSTTPHAIPPGNLQGGAPEIFHFGLRNPYRFSFDMCGGDLYIGDVGQNEWEEIDIAAPGEGPINWGWDCREGAHDFEPQNCTAADMLRDPAHEYAQINAQCGGSVTGGSVYRASAIPWLRGAYIYGDFCTGNIWALRWDGSSVTENVDITADLTEEVGNIGGQEIAGFGNDNDGNVYVTTLSGEVYRVDPQ